MFTGKTVLVTGAAVGIGRAAAQRFAVQGANVILVDRDAAKLEEAKAVLAGAAGRITAFVCDVSDEAAVSETAQQVTALFGGVDILVNNAGIWRDWIAFEEISTERWMNYIGVNLMGTVYFTKAFLGGMKQRKYGRVINVASVAGVYGNAMMSHYSATKGAMISMSRALAKEVAEYGVTVNCVSPGSVSPSENGDPDYFQESPLCYMGRTGTDAENAELICFLAGEAAGYISGQNIQIDGVRKKL
ncbi:MAG: SDR family oxidoreductase [Oscillospiraceae bacterium]|nr:SDR family oxidoreductase [Oscillospiraceae bacterium]